MVLSESQQHMAILQLLLHFKWTWIGFLAAVGTSLEWFVQFMLPVFSRHGICFEFMESFRSVGSDNNKRDLAKWAQYEKIMMSTTNVLVFHGDSRSMIVLRFLLMISKNKETITKSKWKVWVLSAQMDLKTHLSVTSWDAEDFHGSLTVGIHSTDVQGFPEFLKSRKPSSTKEDGFIRNFWAQAFDCKYADTFMTKKDKQIRNCTGEERLEKLPGHLLEMSMTGHSYSIFNAVYAVAHALHDMHLSKSKHKTMMANKRKELWNLQPWQLHQFLRHVSFNNSAGDRISFDQNGILVAGFDIINWVTFPNQSFVRVKVGKVGAASPTDQTVNIKEDIITWPRRFNQTQPFSQCNDNCYPGYRKQIKEGEPFCCYDCIPCPEGKMSAQKDMAECFQCPEDKYPNKNKNECNPKTASFLHYEEPLGMGLAIGAFLLSLTTVLILGIIIKHHNSPLIKANNRNLTYTLLLSLLLCFLCAFLFISVPAKVTCLLRQAAFGIIFSMAVSSVLAKTITVVVAFMATTPGSNMRKWVGRKLGNFIVLFCSLIQAGICFVWLATSPPFPYADLHSESEKIILACNEASPTMFYCVLGYMGFLAIVSFTVAFFSRKLPGSFNESKFITFSMLVFCSVWLCFIPSYLSTKGKSMVAVEIFCILASSAVLLACIFAPKCYILVWRPELNKREQLIKRNV